MKEKLWVRIAALTAAIFLVSSLASAQEILKIGSTVPLSGSYAEVGLAIKHGIDQATDDLNAKGVRIGGKAYKVQAITYDDQFAAAQAALAVRRLVFEDHVKFMVGPFIDDLVMPVSDVLTANKVINIIDGAGRVVINGKTFIGTQNPYMFKAYSDFWEYNPGIYEWMAKAHPEVKTAMGLAMRTVYTDDWLGSAQKAAEANGIKWLGGVIYEPGTTDFYPIITKIIASKPDSIYLAGTTTGDGVLIFKTLADLGWKPGAPVVRGGKFGMDSILRQVDPKILQGAYSFDGSGKEIEKYSPRREVAIYHELTSKWPHATVDYMMWGYNQTYNLVTSIEKANTLDPDAVAKVIENSKWPMTEGDAYFSGLKTFGLKRQTVQNFALSTVNNGQMTFVAWIKCTLQ